MIKIINLYILRKTDNNKHKQWAAQTPSKVLEKYVVPASHIAPVMLLMTTGDTKNVRN